MGYFFKAELDSRSKIMERIVCVEEQNVCDLVRQRIRDAQLWSVPCERSVEKRTHLISPEPFSLDNGLFELLNKLGDAILAFYNAVNSLYLRSEYDWVREYLDIGKSEDIIRHSRMNYQKRALPMVIRPDILLTDEGPIITELDSVPGGIGHLDCLSQAYERAGFDLIGGKRGMRDGFAAIIREVSGKSDPLCAIIVSDESEDYRPEMRYLASQMREAGLRAYTKGPRDVSFTEDGLVIDADGQKLRVDVVYRFFELFDLLNIPKSELISYAMRHKITIITPPYKPFLEEKMLMAFLHNESLRDYWADSLGDENFQLLKQVVAPTYIMDSRNVPPHAHISGFKWRGKHIRDWRDICSGTQKERRLVLKPSGFSPLAWGSRGVKIGHDMPGDGWERAVEDALAGFDTTPYVLQPFYDASIIGVKYHDESSDSIREMQGRVRLCPYYFVKENRAEIGGIMATICQKNKKLIHGMVDAIIAPCSIGTGGDSEITT